MGFGFGPYAVDLDRVIGAIGSRDRDLFQRVAAANVWRFCSLDEDDQDHEPEDRPVAAIEAWGQMIDGGPFDDKAGFKYGLILECLCFMFGRQLLNSELSGRYQEVKDGLSKADAPPGVFRIYRDLMCRGAPVSLPPPADFPGIGYLAADEIGPALEVMGSLDLARIKDHGLRRGMVELTGWLAGCAEADRALISFLY